MLYATIYPPAFNHTHVHICVSNEEVYALNILVAYERAQTYSVGATRMCSMYVYNGCTLCTLVRFSVISTECSRLSVCCMLVRPSSHVRYQKRYTVSCSVWFFALFVFCQPYARPQKRETKKMLVWQKKRDRGFCTQYSLLRSGIKTLFKSVHERCM